ncbi:SCO2400 family protein [Streptomyces sp. WMMC905]|uniref:SCO2400 family protein n=1 Tax=Streptomyces sp. WMMC905 TaxID=3404123 RepID=UPI003B958202
MDYCGPCRRHLNGALVCPGCGTPAASASSAADGRGSVVDGRPDARPSAATVARHYGARGGGRSTGAGRDARAGRASVGHPPRGSGPDRSRAARGRRRRGVVLSAAVGLVLVIGGAAFAELRGGTSQDVRSPVAARGGSPVGDPPVTPTAGASDPPVGSTAPAASAPAAPSLPPSGTPQATASPVVSEEPTPSETPDDASPTSAPAVPDSVEAPEPSPSPTSPTGAEVTPEEETPRPTSPPVSSAASTGPATAPADQAPTSAAPEPSSAETCRRLLWWCL